MLFDALPHERGRRRLLSLPLLAPFMAAFFCGCKSVAPQPVDDLAPLLRQHSEKFGRLLADPEKFRVQILVSEVVDGRLRRHGYRVDAEYFYPASSIKLCGAVGALQTLAQLKCPTDLLHAPMKISPLFPGDAAQSQDASNLAGGNLTVAHELRKLALVSDNQAFNRLYDLVGHEALNRQMHDLGLKSVVINHRLSETRSIPDPQATAAITFFPADGPSVHLPARTSPLALTNTAKSLLVGNGYLQGDQLISTPMDFSRRNGISLVDLQNLLIKLVRPDIDLGTAPLKIEAAHREWLLRAMTEYPRESSNPAYAAERYPDSYSKFLLPGIRRVFPDPAPGRRIEVTGKNGQAYGFSIDNSYSVNPQNHRAVFVTAVIYANEDGILNDDKYDYATVAEPFLADLGELIARRYLGK
ncbi:MAG: serine hydrolase [Verrucomicrobiota bacterium]